MFQELCNTNPDQASLPWGCVTRPMVKKAVNEVREALTKEGITVTDVEIEVRLEKVWKGQNDSRQKGLKQPKEGQHHGEPSQQLSAIEQHDLTPAGEEKTPTETTITPNSTASDAERPYDPAGVKKSRYDPVRDV